MSQHFVERGGLPPGLTSFTKIRLGWISKEQVRFVRPGETAVAFLSPLSVGGKTLAVKIPLSSGKYYLVENRQPVGFDRALPDSGILVLEVNPSAQEGHGTVQIMDANPSSAHFREATYRLDAGGRNIIRDSQVAIIPLWKEDERLGIMVTTPEKSTKALEAARAVDALTRQGGFLDRRIEESKGAFMAFDFKRCIELAGH
jgi:hypothetical protein